MEVPSFIKDSTVAGFYDAQVQVQVCDVLIRCCVTKENASEIVLVEFALAGASAFHADPGSKSPEVCDIGFASIPTFVGSLNCSQVDKSIVKIHSVEQGGQPEFCGEPSALE